MEQKQSTMTSQDPEKAGEVGNATGFTMTDQTNYVSKRKVVTIFLACSTVDFVALMDQTTLAASLLIISDSLGGGSNMSWISGAYFITSTSMQLVYGRLSDIWSRKAILLVGLAVFFIGSLAASLAQTTTQLIVFRALTGVGGGGLMTIAQAIVSDVVTLRERGKYQGILGAVVALANGIGPVVGASLSSKSAQSWRWIFRMNLFLSVLTCIAVVFFMPLKKVTGSWKAKLKQIDYLGIILALGGSTVIVLALTWAGSDYPWKSTHVIAALVIGFLVSIGFVLWQWKGTSVPLVPLRIFRSLLVIGACLTMFVNGWNFLVQVYYIPTFFQLAYGYSAVKAGALLLPVTLMQTISSTLSGLVVHWRGRYRESILAGWIVWAVGLGLFSTLDESSGLGKQIGYGLLVGFGLGQTLQPSLVAIQAGVDRKDMAVVTATRNFIRNLGGTLGLAVSGTIINNILRSTLLTQDISSAAVSQALGSPTKYLSSCTEKQKTELVNAYQRGFRIVFLVCAGLAAVATIVAFITMPQVALDRPDDEKLKAEGKGEDRDITVITQKE